VEHPDHLQVGVVVVPFGAGLNDGGDLSGARLDPPLFLSCCTLSNLTATTNPIVASFILICSTPIREFWHYTPKIDCCVLCVLFVMLRTVGDSRCFAIPRYNCLTDLVITPIRGMSKGLQSNPVNLNAIKHGSNIFIVHHAFRKSR
ncbi:1173_t:CDS:2, partial [Gigaspora rosea]